MMHSETETTATNRAPTRSQASRKNSPLGTPPPPPNPHYHPARADERGLSQQHRQSENQKETEQIPPRPPLEAKSTQQRLPLNLMPPAPTLTRRAPSGSRARRANVRAPRRSGRGSERRRRALLRLSLRLQVRCGEGRRTRLGMGTSSMRGRLRRRIGGGSGSLRGMWM